RQDLPRRAPAVREAGPRGGGPGCDPRRREARGRGRDVRRVQAAPERGGQGEQRRDAVRQHVAQTSGQLMRVTELVIQRPGLAIGVNRVILIAGLQSIRTLTVRQFPRTDVAVITVTTIYVGANADLVRGFITGPIERVLASADGIDYIESSSAQSVSTI